MSQGNVSVSYLRKSRQSCFIIPLLLVSKISWDLLQTFKICPVKLFYTHLWLIQCPAVYFPSYRVPDSEDVPDSYIFQWQSITICIQTFLVPNRLFVCHYEVICPRFRDRCNPNLFLNETSIISLQKTLRAHHRSMICLDSRPSAANNFSFQLVCCIP